VASILVSCPIMMFSQTSGLVVDLLLLPTSHTQLKIETGHHTRRQLKQGSKRV
jgi:hypothetical protein